VHAKCLASWQKRCRGLPEEKQCRFCGSDLPDWKLHIRDVKTFRSSASPICDSDQPHLMATSINTNTTTITGTALNRNTIIEYQAAQAELRQGTTEQVQSIYKLGIYYGGQMYFDIVTLNNEGIEKFKLNVVNLIGSSTKGIKWVFNLAGNAQIIKTDINNISLILTLAKELVRCYQTFDDFLMYGFIEGEIVNNITI
jgi:hypothetical protein